MIALLVAMMAALGVWLLLPGGADGLGRLRAAASRPAGRAPRRRLAGVAAGGAGMLIGVALLWGPGAAAVALALGQVALCGGWLGWRRRRRLRRTRARVEVVEAGEAVAGLLRVGRVPSAALVEAARDVPLLRVAAAELVAGGETATALRRSAAGPGYEGLHDLADAWDVSVRSGGSLVGAVDAASSRLAAADDVARVVEAELSAARLGGRVLAALPLVGIGLGYAFGGDPVGFLTGSVFGWVCLDLGVGLACAGIVWIDGVAERAGGR